MAYLNDYEKQAELILTHLKQENIALSPESINVIKNCIKEAYGVGYENGLADEQEITENPISG